jgi:hypothetical protein
MLRRLGEIVLPRLADQDDVSATAADSFFARCLPDAGCAALARSAAFLRSRYALRRLRLACTRCCCPTGMSYRLKR